MNASTWRRPQRLAGRSRTPTSGSWSNPAASAVATVRERARAVAAMRRSCAPRVRPSVRVCASRAAWALATSMSYGSTGMVASSESTTLCGWPGAAAVRAPHRPSAPPPSPLRSRRRLHRRSPRRWPCWRARPRSGRSYRGSAVPAANLGLEPGAQLSQLPRPARIGWLDAQEVLDDSARDRRRRRDARNGTPAPLHQEGLAVTLHLIEEVRKAPRRFGRRKPSHANQT